jgi:hypothetical protein
MRHTTLTQFLVGLLVMLAIALAAGIWAYAGWLEHYA